MDRKRNIPLIKAQSKPAMIKYLLDEELTEAESYICFASDGEKRKAWQRNRKKLLETFIAEHPGKRPEAWWRYDAPEPRRRLGGTGTPAYEVLAYVPHFKKGLPTLWVSSFDERYYNGRAIDIHGNAIGRFRRDGTPRMDGDFKGRAIDPNDPPRFESQAAFLKRHGLLLPGELERLTEKDFKPETVKRHD